MVHGWYMHGSCNESIIFKITGFSLVYFILSGNLEKRRNEEARLLREQEKINKDSKYGSPPKYSAQQVRIPVEDQPIKDLTGDNDHTIAENNTNIVDSP